MLRPSPHLLCLGATILAVAWPRPGGARAEQQAPVVVIPAGAGATLEPTAQVARELVRRLNAQEKNKARLAYFLPEQPPPAQDVKAKERQAAKLLKRAQAAYEQMDYEKAQEQLKETLKIYKSLLKRDVPVDGYSLALHLLAAAALLQGDNKKAARAMNDAVLFDPRPPSKKLFNPSVQELYEQVRAEPPGQATVILQTTPPSMVWFNKVFRGPAQGRFAVRAGLYLIRCYLPGYGVLQRWLRVQPSQERRLELTLAKDDVPEAEVMSRVREEIRRSEPGPTITQLALDAGAEEVVLVTAGAATKPGQIAVESHWAKDGHWQSRSSGIFAGRADVAAAALLGINLKAAERPRAEELPPMDLTSELGNCTIDTQCPAGQRCRYGRCAEHTPVTRKWWFWTAVGVATAGLTLSIVLPLSMADRPVIEVK